MKEIPVKVSIRHFIGKIATFNINYKPSIFLKINKLGEK
jgi:hypothetical protein